MPLNDLINELEDIINQSRRLPLSSMVIIDEQQLFELLDRMRNALDTLNTTVHHQQEVTQQLREQGLLSAADLERARILEQAHSDADYIRNGANEYAHEVLAELDERLERVAMSVKNGLRELERIQRKHTSQQDIG
jgi:cell division septum initiation protein DivIVA